MNSRGLKIIVLLTLSVFLLPEVVSANLWAEWNAIESKLIACEEEREELLGDIKFAKENLQAFLDDGAVPWDRAIESIVHSRRKLEKVQDCITKMNKLLANLKKWYPDVFGGESGSIDSGPTYDRRLDPSVAEVTARTDELDRDLTAANQEITGLLETAEEHSPR